MSSKKIKQPLFHHEVVRYLQKVTDNPWERSTREVIFKIFPSKLSAYNLGISIKHGVGDELREVYEREFMARTSHYIEKSCEQENLSIATFKAVFRPNIPLIVKRTLDARYMNPNFQFIYRDFSGYPLSKDAKETNRSIFMMRMSDTIRLLAGSEHFKGVCEDYELVQEVKNNPDKFCELEKKCMGQLRRFSANTIKGIDKESQQQEGLLAIWAAAQVYEGRNLARFTTLAKTALNNKFISLIRYSQATKRKANRHLLDLGRASFSKDSFPASLLDRLVYEQWERQQAVYDAIDTGISAKRLKNLSEEEINTLRQAEFSGRAISPAELNSDLINLPPMYKWLYRNKGFEMGRFDTLARIQQNGDPNHLVEVDETNFPHLNEKEIDLSHSVERLDWEDLNAYEQSKLMGKNLSYTDDDYGN